MKAANKDPEAQIHLAMDRQSYARIMWLKDALEAASVSEVIRRALQAFELMEPADISKNIDLSFVSDKTECQEEEVYNVHVRLSEFSKARLDREKETNGCSYSDVVVQSLRVLCQLVADRRSFLETGRVGLASQPSASSKEKRFAYVKHLALL